MISGSPCWNYYICTVSKKRIIVSVINDLATDQRVRKVCEALVEFDYDVLLVGRKLKTSMPMPETEYATKRMKLIFTKGAAFYAFFNLRLFFFLLFKKADVLLANDLDTLHANAWARKFKSKCKLIYDSHEYFTGVPELVQRPKVQQFWKKIERKHLPKVDEMYTVNDSIAKLYRDEYGVEMKVVRNISDYRGEVVPVSKEELGLPSKFTIIMQGAGINIDRGAEEMLEAIKEIPDAVFLIVGSGDVIDILKTQVELLEISERVIFKGKLPYSEMMKYTSAADLGVSLDKDTNVNYRFSLPNKLFDYIHAATPVMVTDLVEVKRIVEEHRVGVVLEDLEPTTIKEKVERLIQDKKLYSALVENTKTASEILTWENEKKVLKSIYG